MGRGDAQAIPQAIEAALLGKADISLTGDVGKDMLDSFLDQLGKARDTEGDIVLELTTEGGDADLARRICSEIERAHDRLKGEFLFLGKSVVYSAGVSIMSSFPRKNRYLTRETLLLVHGRQMDRTLELSGPIRTSLAVVEALVAQIRIGLTLEEEGLRRLIDGSRLSLEEVIRKGTENWYLTAEEASDLDLVAACV